MKRILLMLLLTLLMFSCKLKDDDDNNDDDNPVSPGKTGSLVISSPAGGDSLFVASSFEIFWTSENITQKLNISYSVNNGANWTRIASNVENSGSYVWNPVPNQVSGQCRIKITTADSTVSVMNSGVFRILKSAELSLELVKPNGGEIYLLSDSVKIQWNSTGIEYLRIEASIDKGSNWQLIDPAADAYPGEFAWLPDDNMVSTNCLVKVSDVNPNSLFDQSDDVFSILVPQFIMVKSPNGGESWKSNSTQTITWLSSEVENVKIEYTTNNGLEWKIITESTESDGYYIWEDLPSTPSTMVKVRISDALDNYPVDVSDDLFSIIPEDALSVLTPNGGEELVSGGSYVIKWDAPQSDSKVNLSGGKKKYSGVSGTDGITAVVISFSSNNGAEWSVIADDEINDGEFLWEEIPQVNSDLCLIKIADKNDGLPYDISDKVFTITSGQPASITVNSPNGGEQWEAGSTQVITWNSKGVEKVNILYSINNGINWLPIVENTESDGFYSWVKVPSTASNNCKIKIMAAGSMLPYDESDLTFSITPEPEIVVKFPDGGEVLQSGVPYDIKWTSSNIENVKIEFTSNSGAVWQTIEESVQSTGIYNWSSVPEINSSQCRIRVSDAQDGMPFDISNENFRVKNQVEQTLALNTPNGGEVWEAGTNHNITWDASAVTAISIEYTTNNGTNWEVLAENIVNTGSYAWNPVPDVNSTQCKVKIYDASDNSPVDVSDGFFTIKPVPSLSIISPNGDEMFTAGQPVNIIWESTGVENVKIEYTINNGISPEDWFILVASTPSDGLYETGFSIPSEKYRIRISEANTGAPVDESNGTFTISPQPGIWVESPNGGEDWLTGTTVEIRWDATNIENVNIEYSIDGGALWKNIVNNIPSNGLYNWTIPESIDFRSDLCLVRISDASDGSPSDQSDNFFTIHPEDKLLRWTFPNGGEFIYREPNRSDTLITWISAGIEFVDIEYTSDNGQTWNTIVNNYHSTGAFLWTIPNGQPSTLARVRIFDSSNHDTTDMSDSHFYLRIAPGLDFYGSGKEIIANDNNKTLSFKWTAPPDLKNIRTEYSIDEGITWNIFGENQLNRGEVNNSDLKIPTDRDKYLIRLVSGGEVSSARVVKKYK